MANIVNTTGRLVADPKTFPNKDGSQTVLFTIAARRNYANRQGVVESDFIPFTAYISKDRVSKNPFMYLKKGMLVGIEASIRSYTTTNADGSTNYGVNLQVNRVEFLESKATVDARAQAAQAAVAQAPVAQ